MKVNLIVEDDDEERAISESYKIMDDFWNRYPKAQVSRSRLLPKGKTIELEIN